MKYKKSAVIVFTALVACACAYIAHEAFVVSIDEEKHYKVVSVIDGDTFKVKVGWHTITVRMLGIDTPETVDPRKPAQCYGKEASDETKKLLTGKSVSLRLNPKREEKDRYGRYLAYAYLGEGTFLNGYLLENGFAREYTYGKAYMYQKEFRSLEKEAKESKVGLWGVCEIIGSKSTQP